MDAPPNLERTSSLTWSGIGGLNWDRTAVIPTAGNARDGAPFGKPNRGASLSVVEFQSPSPPPHPVSGVDALLNDDDDLLPPPSLLRRSVTFSGDFPHGEGEGETLVATAPPGILGGPRPTGGVQQRQRATSDVAAVRAAWGPSDPGSLSPEGFSYSPALGSQHKAIPRRAHSMSLEASVWGPGIESPRERSRTMNTLSVGSPDTEVLEYMEGDELGFGSSTAPRDSKLGQAYSPMQHVPYPSVSSQQPPLLPQTALSQTPPTQARFPAKPSTASSSATSTSFLSQSQTSSATLNQASMQHQNFGSPRHATSPPFQAYQTTAPQMGGMPNLTPAQLNLLNSARSSGEDKYAQGLVEVQLQNLQAMQQQWMQMMQVQFDQTMYAAQQRLQGMQVGSGTTPPNLNFQPQSSKYAASSAAPTMNAYDSSSFGMSAPHHVSYSGPNGFGGMNPSPSGVAGGARSPPARSHRRESDRNGNHSSNESGSTSANHAASNLLTEHKITGRRLTAQELLGHVVEFSRDSHGSRLVQFKMETGTPEERRAFVTEALPHTLSLAKDLFGNYVIQNFFDNASADQRDTLAIALMGNVSSLCTHPHGCRVVQRALLAISPPRRNDLIEELLELQIINQPRTEQIIRSCARDAHATHVLQKAVTCLQKAVGLKSYFKEANATEDTMDPPQEQARAQRALERIEYFVLADTISMSTHQQACRLVQRVIGACEPGKTPPHVEQILKEVFRKIDALAIHQNGNFVLQHILESTDPVLAARVQAYVCMNAVRLARHKFGSHLVEKSLSCATPAQVNAIVDRFLAPLTKDMMDVKEDFEAAIADDTSSGLVPSSLPVLMKDPYANFVVQKAFDVSRGEVRARLSQEIRARTVSLNKFSYGRHIVNHINRGNNSNTVQSTSATAANQ